MSTYSGKPANESVSPNLDMISKKTVFFRNAYANSFQTVRGELAILCSTYDYMRGAPYSESNQRPPTNCLPNILKSNGYETHWIHGYNKEFFNRGNFFPKLGYEFIHDQSVLSQSGYKDVLGWGTPDTDLFEYSINTLEQIKKPFFAELLTLSNHFPFEWEWNIDFPEYLQQLPNDPDNKYINYKRGMYYTDHAVGMFWNAFKKSPLYENTIVIFTADHGIWLFEEELDQNKSDIAAFIKKEQYFRIPMMMHIPGFSSENSEVSNIVSQLDISPTILNLLGISADTSFWGRNLFSPINNPLATYIGSGHHSFRYENNYCHPSSTETSQTCNEEKQNVQCNYKQQGRAPYDCVQINGDILTQTNIQYERTFLSDKINDVRMAMEYSQHGLKHGLYPNDQLTTGARQKKH